MSIADTVWSRLQGYNAFWEKVLFGLSLLGVFVVVHLAIQQGRNFVNGCLGVAGLGGGQMAFDCSAVVSSGAGTFLGLSNTTWGLGFYLGIAILTLIIFWGEHKSWRAWVHGIRIGALAAGALYSGYLFYVQVAVLAALCLLCLVSTVITILLLVLQGLILSVDVQSKNRTMSPRLFKRDLTIYVYLIALTTVLVGADLTYFNALAPASDGTQATADPSFTGAACQLDPEKDPVGEETALVGFQDVTKGPADADVTVVEYFDPNCPHCKTFHETMKTLVSEYQDEVQFVFKPFPLRGSHLPEIQALYVAHEEGKFTEMLEAQYERQSRSGISEQDLRSIADEIGMNADVLMSQVDQNKYREQIIKERKQAINIGVDSTPTVLVNGHFAGSRSQECMEVFIEQAQAGTLGQSASG